MKVIAAVSGGFDPLHNGHLDSILKAAKMGDILLVFVSNDADMVRKKGFVCIPMKLRMKIVKLVLRYYHVRGKVLETLDEDGTQCKTLEYYKPDYYCKGGDRTEENMNQREVEVCKKWNIKIAYGIGDLLNSSTRIAKEANIDC